MTKVLILLLVLCAFATAMVPRERRAVDLEELPASSSTTTAAPNICAPTTPCGWSIYKPQIKIIDMFVVNGYCICEEGLNCAIDEDDKSESFAPSDNRNMSNPSEGVFSPMAPPFQARGGNELMNLLAQQEPRAADTAPTAANMDDVLMNFRMNGSELLFDDMDQNSQNYFNMGNTRSESVASSSANLWGDGSSVTAGRNGEMMDTFDFLIKSLSSANNYVSMLTREQLSVLRSIRPSVLYEFLQEVAKVRSDKRMRRALPNECAFCKNNGENEECYSSHALKDWRGRVLCPVLRAFRCPRCGATGDHAHTIKYCTVNKYPENSDAGSDRSVGGLSRRRAPTAGLAGLTLRSAPATPAPAPSPSPSTAALTHASLWSTFGIN